MIIYYSTFYFLQLSFKSYSYSDFFILAINKQKPGNLSTIDLYKFEELETSLLIQKDENDALKAALKSTLEAKEEGLLNFSIIIKTIGV